MSGPENSWERPTEGSGEIHPGGTGDLVAKANLVVVSGALSGRVYPLLRSETLIGRTTDAPICINDRATSTRHALIVQTQDGHSIQDLGSTNGTFLNGRRLQPDTLFPLGPGDNVQVAETVFAYLSADTRDPQQQTHYLSRLLPQGPNPQAMRLADPSGMPEAELFARLIQLSNPPEPEQKSFTIEERIAQLKRLWAILRRNWVSFFVATALCALAGNISVLLRPPIAQAHVKLRITPPPEEREEAWDTQGQAARVAVVRDAFVSPALVEGTLFKMGGVRPSPERVGYTKGAMALDAAGRDTYEGKYSHRDPNFAVEVLRHHVENFLATEIKKNLTVQQAAVDFLASQVKDRERELIHMEEELKKFKAVNLERLPEYANDHVSNREALMARKLELGAVMSKANLELAQARKRLSEEAPLLTKRAESVSPFEQSLIDVKKKLGEARGKGLGSQHPEVVALVKQEVELQKMAEQARASEVTGIAREGNAGLIALRNQVGDLEVASKAAGAELGAVNEMLSRQNSIVGDLPEIEARYAQLTRSYNVSKDIHAKLFGELRDSQLKLDLERASAKARYEVVEPPETGGVQIRKLFLSRTLLGIGVGLALGAVIAAFLELRRYLRSRKAVSTAMVVAEPSE
jgi:pSer/pThr/pTyr-binding forkhead associated (FHA) protein/uncharacterized protein involved in exopolysaccharide biosynthesis